MESLDALSVFTRSRPSPTTDLGEAATTFEAYLLGEIMRKGAQPIGGESLLDGGSAGRMYREMFYQELAQAAARRGGFGLSNWIERQAGSADTQATDAASAGTDRHRSDP